MVTSQLHVCCYMCVATCVLLHVCCYMCVFTCVLSHVCFHMCVVTCVLLHVPDKGVMALLLPPRHPSRGTVPQTPRPCSLLPTLLPSVTYSSLPALALHARLDACSSTLCPIACFLYPVPAVPCSVHCRYANTLVQHGETVLTVANLAFEGTPIAAKVGLLHTAYCTLHTAHCVAWHGVALYSIAR